MSSIKTTLTELVRYYDSNRGVGHTAAMLTGAQNMGECLVVAANQADVAHLWKGPDTSFVVVSLSNLELGDARGHKFPMVLDNHALTELARQSLGEISRLEDKIREMKAVAQAIADVNLYD
jgi:hypothetical protein